MRFARVLLATVTLFSVSACADAVASTAGVWIEVNPATVTAGFQVSIRASCNDNTNPATVKSNAFGTVTVHPVNGLLLAEVMVASDTPEGVYDVRMTCPSGSRANTNLTVRNTSVVQKQPTLGPDTGGGFLAGGGDSPDRSPYVWLGVGLTSLLAAAAMTVRTKRQGRRPTVATGQTVAPGPAIAPGRSDGGPTDAVRRR
jgi:hypothetical protein